MIAFSRDQVPLPGRAAHASRGSALLIVMWALIILSTAVFAWARWIHQELEMYGEANRAMEARAMAHSGIAMALHPLVSRATPTLTATLNPGAGYQVKMVSEGGKLNLRWWLEGEDPRKIAILKLWLEQHGLDFQQRERFMDCLLDYIDPDDLHRLNGVEDDGDYHPANRPLESIDELAAVQGAEPLLKSPGWRDHLTLESQGPVDLTSAPEEILRILPGFSEPRLQTLLTLRRGKDKQEGTADDPEFQNVGQLLGFLGFSPAQVQSMAGFVMVNDRTMHIVSTGTSGKVVRQVEVVARKTGGNPQILSWNE